MLANNKWVTCHSAHQWCLPPLRIKKTFHPTLPTLFTRKGKILKLQPNQAPKYMYVDERRRHGVRR